MSVRKMGSNKSHGRKSDKETQSPMLKIFKDIMQREKIDPEKANLLKGKHEDRKRKHYSESRTKLERKCDSSGSERQKNSVRDLKYNAADQEVRNTEYEQYRTRSFGDKRDSWWFWAAQTEEKKPDGDETCSCVSCALKKLIGTEYACIGCLVLIFIITVLIAFLLVFKNVPPLNCDVKDKPHVPKAGLDSERLKRKIDLLNAKGWDSNFVGGKENVDGGWRDSMSTYSSDLGSDIFHDLNKNEDYEAKSSELSSIFDTEKINEIQSNDNLREFYKKLIETDAQIRKLKNSFNDYTIMNTDTFEDRLKIQDRLKRSLECRTKKFPRYKRKMDNVTKQVKPKKPFHIFHSPITILRHNKNTNKTMRSRRNDNYSEPIGFVIEKKKVIVQYQPNVANRKVPKCSHVPKESKSHEKQLKHPFYKNTQRLDELLDQFIDKNLHEIMSDPFGIEVVLDKEKNKCKHPNPYKNDKVLGKEDHNKQLPKSMYDKDRSEEAKLLQYTRTVVKPESTTSFENDLFSRDFNVDIRHVYDKKTTTNAYDILMSVSTVINSDIMTSTSNADLMARVPNLRKLMQIEEDDENHGFQDMKEVLTDDTEANDDIVESLNRNKRFGDTEPYNQKYATKYNPPGVHNPNWKGPMPLYPDELTSMIKQAAMSISKDNFPVNTKDISPEIDNSESDIGDVEYIEDYLSNKYDKLAEMAQAYSDYGVLDEKKETANDKKASNDLSDHRIKLSVGKGGFFKQFFKRPKKGSDFAEGLKFELKPTTSSRDDSPKEIYKTLHKHIKITNSHDGRPDGIGSNTPMETRSNIESVLSPDEGHSSRTENDKKKKNVENENNSFFSFSRRALKSIHYDDDEDLAKNLTLNITHEKEIMMTLLKDNGYVDNFKEKQINKRESVPHNIINETNVLKSDKPVNKSIEDNVIVVEEDKESDMKINKTIAGMDLSQFFGMLSNFFSFLDGVDSSNTTKYSTEKLNLKVKTAQINTITTENNSIDIVYPIYDSEMIDNIGHRSRVLLSINDNNVTVNNYSKSETGIEDIKGTDGKSADNLEVKTEPVKALTITTLTTSKILKTEKPLTGEQSIKNANENDISKKNKTIVKRNAEDTNLIFWNDMYDDEYGIKTDPFENTIRDKHSVKRNDFVKKSGMWFQDKFRKIAKLTDNWHGNKESKKRSSRQIKHLGKKTIPEDRFKDQFVNKVPKKEIERTVNKDDESTDRKQNFEVLTANMKEVCRKAAEAVRKTKNIEVREDSKESQVATTLMQQLVRLMSELVDFQVQQKTCSKLPRDLQNFLEWLTYPTQERSSDTDMYSPGLKHEDILTDFDANGPTEKWSEHAQEPIPMPSSEKSLYAEEHPSTQALASLEAVQELMRQYEELSEEDKSKMSGIKQYLDKQLDYLQSKISSVDEYNIHENKDLLRFRRELSKRRNKIFKCRRRKKRKLHLKPTRNKFIKSYDRKHTHTTASYYDVVQMADLKNKPTNVPDAEVLSKNVKRNLKDIYYKAIEDAKKITTIKKLHKKMVDDEFQETSTIEYIKSQS